MDAERDSNITYLTALMIFFNVSNINIKSNWTSDNEMLDIISYCAMFLIVFNKKAHIISSLLRISTDF